jgi:chromate reductase
MQVTLYEGLRDIPPYDDDLRTGSGYPPHVAAFRAAIKEADALVIASPEYNFSISGVLKNALDWASRPVTETPLNDKPVVLQSASTNFAGGARAQYHLRQVLGYFPMKQMFFPELFVNSAKGKFDESGNLIDPESKDRIAKQLQAFKEFIIAERRP